MRIHWKTFWIIWFGCVIVCLAWIDVLGNVKWARERLHENTLLWNITHPIRNENLTIHLSKPTRQTNGKRKWRGKKQEKNKREYETDGSTEKKNGRSKEVEVTMKNSLLSRTARNACEQVNERSHFLLFSFFATYFFCTECCQSTFSLGFCIIFFPFFSSFHSSGVKW